MKLEEAFGEAVRIKRRAAGLSQEGFAEVLGMQATAISRLERGVVSPTLDMILRVATAFQITPSSLLAQAEQIQVYAASTVTPLHPGAPRKK